MRVKEEEAFVLHCRNYGETSLLVELFSRNHGRIGVIAKGARVSRAKYGAVLLPFQPVLASWSGKGDLPTLTHVETVDREISLQGNALFCGFYVNELMLRLFHRYEAHESLFQHYQRTLEALQEGNIEAVLRVFEKRLLTELGYGLVLDHDIDSQSAIDAMVIYVYIPDAGPRRLYDDSSAGVKIRGKSLMDLASEQLEDSITLHEVKFLMRTLINRHLGSRPLHSRRLLQSMKANRRQHNKKEA